MSELKFKPWPGNQFDFSDKELFQIHEDLCDDLEITGYSESDIVKVSVGIWAGLKFAQDNKKQLEALKKENDGLRKERDELKDKVERLEGTCQNTFDRWQKAMDDREVVQTQLSEAIKERDELKATYAMPPLGSAGQVIRHYQEKLAEAIKALEFYADKLTWLGNLVLAKDLEQFNHKGMKYEAGGKLARQTLEKLKGEVKPKVTICTCPPKKNDGDPFDGVSYYCPLHGR